MVTVKTTKKPTGDKSFPIWDYTALLVKSQGGIIFMELENLLKVEYRGERVLSTKQIAILYGCSKDYIRKNFKDAKEHFVEGIHYFYLEGDELKKFKQYLAKLQAKSSDVTNSHAAELPCTKLASSLILWTEKGAVRHCKMVGTQKAWDVFTVLENSYFGQKVDLPEIETPFEMAEDAENLTQSPLFTLSDEIELLMKLLDYTGNQELRDRIIIKIAEKILGEKLF